MYKMIGIPVVWAVTAFAQTPAVPKDVLIARPSTVQLGDAAEFGPIGITAAVAGPMSTIAGAPYSAQVVTQRVQALADGNRIDQTTSGSVARDSQGRVRREESLPGLGSGDGNGPQLVRIEDPVAGVHWTLDARTKTAIKMPFPTTKVLSKTDGPMPALPAPPPIGPERTFFYSSTVPAAPGNVQIITRAVPESNANVSKTELGTQTVEGVPAQGTRVTRTIPAGAVGNEQPLVITTETWFSPDLKILVMSKTEDPRMGETTYKLTNIQRSEPSADLFQIPSDYTERSQPTNVLFHREIKADK
jgi:hypothetical protein